eukprot:233112_1
MRHHCIYPTTNTPFNTTFYNHYYKIPFQSTLQQHSNPTLFNVKLSTTSTTTFHYNYYISNHHTLLSLSQHQCPIILIPLLHILIQFAHWKQWQVVPFTTSSYCNNISTILLFLKLYLIYYILIFICLQQFVDCLQPQVATLSNPYDIQLE